MTGQVITLLFFTFFLFSTVDGNNIAPVESDVQQHPGLHKGTAREVLQTGNYTYVLLETGEGKQWVAIPRTDIITGNTYYYGNGILMPDFTSKELTRTFSSILLLERLFPEPQDVGKSVPAEEYTANVKTEKAGVSVKKDSAMITVAQLWKNRNNYDGKITLIKGKVTKFNPDIMGKNWIHIQDGTEYDNHFDLTATCNCSVSVGDVITLRGIIILDKDFGYGYKYEILLEDAVLIK